MKVFCEYNQEYDAFLKEAVQYTLDRYESRLELSNLEEIELIDKSKIKIETDGRTCRSGKKIVVTSRLYEMLPSYNIPDIEEDANFKLIINTLYHEMGHVTDWVHMPITYNTVCNSPKTEGGISALVWVEYLAEKRSNAERTDDYDELCEGFSKSKWRAYKSDLDSAGSDNFSYLVKTIPYFIARTQKPEAREKYFAIMVNPMVKDFVVDLENELVKLENECPFDDLQKLSGIYEIINRYYKKFKSKYGPQNPFSRLMGI